MPMLLPMAHGEIDRISFSVGWDALGGNFLRRFQKFGQIGDISAEHAVPDADAASDGLR